MTKARSVNAAPATVKCNSWYGNAMTYGMTFFRHDTASVESMTLRCTKVLFRVLCHRRPLVCVWPSDFGLPVSGARQEPPACWFAGNDRNDSYRSTLRVLLTCVHRYMRQVKESCARNGLKIDQIG
jgi:hypothetical protein